ncbi:class IV adenylate cyclase [Isosphaeraceae bacterium EP7]
MGYEVEIKFRCPDHGAISKRLMALGAGPGAEVEQADAYLAHPSRDFAATNEALRIRREGAENRVTYKGPKHPGPTKTREEIEIPFQGGQEGFEATSRLFEALGFRPVAVVRKRRIPHHVRFQGRELEVTLDLAEELGPFVEVEALAADAADLPAAQAAVQALAAELGLTDASVEPRSYLRMLLELSGNQG